LEVIMRSTPDGRSEQSLDELARRARAGDMAASVEFQERMQSSLGPIVRLAMRRGQGPEHVVRWVRQAAARTPAPDSRELTQQLCAELLRTQPSGPGSRRGNADTIVGV
jgi:hypothetical protein